MEEMVTDQDGVRLVTEPTPVDMTGVRDPGMQALIQLAVSLGWNVHKKHNQPVVITARDGTQKRLPTNTSIRMSVFQTALSTIMVHTEPDVIPTVELIDKILATIKVSTEHSRRLYLAVGETLTEHRERVRAQEAGPGTPKEPQPLTTRIEIPEGAWSTEETLLSDMGLWDEKYTNEPADGGDHGTLMDVRDFLATRQHKGDGADKYKSDTSYEREWEDGFIDYVCILCGAAYRTAKGVGSHRQIHSAKRGGEVDLSIPAWQRARREDDVHVPLPEPAIEWEDPPPTGWVGPADEPAARAARPIEEADPLTQAVVAELRESVPFDDAEPEDLLQVIRTLLLPATMAEVEGLRAENQRLRDRLDEVEGEFDAFIELAASRRKRGEGA